MRKKTTRKRSNRFSLFRVVLLAGLLLTLSLIFLVATLGSQKFGSLHRLVIEAVGPVQKLVAAGGASIGNFKSEYLDILQDVLKVREENKRLLKQLQETEATLNRSREALATNASLRRLLEFKNSLNRPMIAATVIGKDPSVWFRSVIIDQGSSKGLAKGSPVVNADGVVGQVFALEFQHRDTAIHQLNHKVGIKPAA